MNQYCPSLINVIVKKKKDFFFDKGGLNIKIIQDVSWELHCITCIWMISIGTYIVLSYWIVKKQSTLYTQFNIYAFVVKHLFITIRT